VRLSGSRLDRERTHNRSDGGSSPPRPNLSPSRKPFIPVHPPPAHPRFARIDTLRALAALAVVVTHANEQAHPLGEQTAGDRLLTYLGPTGVAVFFVLSAFLLYRPFVASRIHGSPRPAPGRFVRRRLLRILPAYWVALAGFAVWPGGLGIPGPDAVQIALLGQIYSADTMREGIIPAWSLGVEMSFYALLLLVGLSHGRRGLGSAQREWLILAGLASGYLLVRMLMAVGDADGGQVEETLAGYLPWFLLGMAAAVLSVQAATYPTGRPAAVAAAIAQWPNALWVAALLAFSAIALAPVAESRVVLRTCQGLAAILFVLPGAFAIRRASVVHRVTSSAALAWLGLVSYGIYLFHYPVVGELGDRLDGLPAGPEFVAVAVLGALAATALAAASFYGYERRLLRLGERPRGNWRGAGAAAGGAVAQRSEHPTHDPLLYNRKTENHGES
jgi:peptidoglycan/LPS O-acetylase OafA/YrhL